MSKNFQDFLNTVDYNELFESICNEFSKEYQSQPAEYSLYKAIPKFEIKMLEKYHNWLNQ